MLPDKAFGSPANALALGSRYRADSSSIQGSVPIADLDDNEARTVAHDEVEFTVAAAKIGTDMFQSLPDQPSAREFFGTPDPCAGVLCSRRPAYCRLITISAS
jgi:hypothetical protein